ncbi:flagellar hook-associated protein FlgL [Pandoraea apista]|uniref:flagellar hook-associated protein FlgL n=1 Tax=Pandoraea apista TaxID=93218 RepID=UPI001639655E|nr:flagellar hook-associated protein FlgL [Pandoraea apista]
MRVTSNQIHDAMNQATQRATVELSDTMLRMMSEKRILRSSDDPIGAVRLAQLAQSNAALEQYRSDVPNIMSRLKLGEFSLSTMSNALGEARRLLLQASDGSSGSLDKKGIAAELVAVRDRLVQFSSARDSSGHYLFSGTAIKTAPIAFNPAAAAGARYTFAGNTEKQSVVIGEGVTEIVNDNLKGVEVALNKLDSIIEQFGSGAKITANRDVFDAIDHANSLVTSKISRLGNAQNTLTMFDDLHAASQIVTAQAAQDAGKIDRNEVYEAYMSYRTALEATQKVYAHVSQLSLFNIL